MRSVPYMWLGRSPGPAVQFQSLLPLSLSCEQSRIPHLKSLDTASAGFSVMGHTKESKTKPKCSWYPWDGHTSCGMQHMVEEGQAGHPLLVASTALVGHSWVPALCSAKNQSLCGSSLTHGSVGNPIMSGTRGFGVDTSARASMGVLGQSIHCLSGTIFSHPQTP